MRDIFEGSREAAEIREYDVILENIVDKIKPNYYHLEC